jgi:hypothetical protein
MKSHAWRRATAWMPGLLAIAALAAGCGDDGVTPPAEVAQPAEMSIDLNAPDGGLTPTNETPSFGDTYFTRYLGEGVDAEVTGDPLAADPAIAELENDPETKVMFLRILWGNLRRGPEGESNWDGQVLDWSGNAEVSEGILRPLRTLRFERGDHLVPPWLQGDPSRQKLVWVSHTGPGQDGILVKIVVPVADDEALAQRGLAPQGDGLTEDDTFTFTTGPLTVSFRLDEIADLDRVIPVDDANGVSFQGFDRGDLDICPRGTLEGAWVRIPDDPFQGGYFRARWVGPLGNVIGHVRGRWGVAANQEPVFVGKLIHRDGTFLAFVRGSWAPDPEDPTRGTFLGAWGLPDQPIGHLRGVWAVSPRLDQGGFLRGGWAAECAQTEAPAS